MVQALISSLFLDPDDSIRLAAVSAITNVCKWGA
jgi:hypothetical protein